MIFEDSNVHADFFSPIEFTANPGDSLRIVADDSFGVCRSLSPDLSLHRLDTGEIQFLGGYQEECGGAGERTVFFDVSFIIGDSSAPTGEQRFFQFNMCGSAGGPQGGNRNKDCDPSDVAEATARSIREFHPTFVTLNEVCFDQLAEIEDALTKTDRLSDDDQGTWPMHSSFVATRANGTRCESGLFGNAVLASGPVESDPESPYVLPGGGPETRQMVCLVSTASLIRVRVCSTHLAPSKKPQKHEKKPAKKLTLTEEQVVEVARLANVWISEGDAVVVGGDFNLQPDQLWSLSTVEGSDGDAVAAFLNEFMDVDVSETPTHDEGKIDYIFLPRSYYSNIFGFPTSSDDSDHKPLRGWATLGFWA